VSAVNVRTGVLKRFCNYLGSRIRKHRKEQDEPALIGPRHILASCSLPPQFPWTIITDRDSTDPYWDGGIVDNTPLGEVMEAFSTGDHVDRVLVVMNLYPLGGRLPGNLAEVEDRKHELSFGNRTRQDGDTARRINDLVGTIKELEALATQPLSEDLKRRVDRASLYKFVHVVQIELQHNDDASDPAHQSTVDDAQGLRDFSRATVQWRRQLGHQRAFEELSKYMSEQPAASDALPRRASKQV
jgi:NTE family protein